MWAFINKLRSPKWFYAISAKLQPLFWVAATLLLLVGTVWGLAFAPADYQQGNSFRIIYVHVPAAFLAQSIFVSMAVSGLVFMVWKIKVADMAATVMAPLGAAMTFVALFSGAVWGVPTWGTWWMWDARLTSMLILLFLYLGVIALRGAFSSRDSGSCRVGAGHGRRHQYPHHQVLCRLVLYPSPACHFHDYRALCHDHGHVGTAAHHGIGLLQFFYCPHADAHAQRNSPSRSQQALGA